MPRQKSVDEVVDKAAKRNIFPNITTAYAVLESQTVSVRIPVLP